MKVNPRELGLTPDDGQIASQVEFEALAGGVFGRRPLEDDTIGYVEPIVRARDGIDIVDDGYGGRFRRSRHGHGRRDELALLADDSVGPATGLQVEGLAPEDVEGLAIYHRTGGAGLSGTVELDAA